ncbi:MAG TPA: SulP family inorganic anion transporter [Burkholderiales bacterium]|nr:SulP family inorganic anion transporter [Burkholderiales bacterium]
MPALHFRPALIDALKDYSLGRLAKDASAGLIVAVVALPLAMAFAIASGLKPEAGIFTAIIAGFLISLLGGSRVQIGGPAGAFIVVVYGIVDTYGVANLLVSTLCAGVLLFLMGALKLGKLVRFIPISLVIGFTNGIAVLIMFSQIKDFLGLRIENLPAEFFAQLETLAGHVDTANPYSIALGAASLLLVVLWPKSYSASNSRIYRALAHVPGTLIVLVLGTVAVAIFQIPVETIGSRFGGIPQSLPQLDFPAFEWRSVQHLFGPIVTIALLGAIESLLCARVADSMIGDRHDPNQELMAQGAANFIAPLFGGFCATGTIARTATNVRAGATSPIAGIIHSLVLVLVLLVAAPLAQNIPLASLAAILFFVAWNMGEWREFARLRQFSDKHRIIFLSTFILTIVVDLTVAVEVGIVLACLFFVVRVARSTKIDVMDETERYGMPAYVEMYRIVGALFFGAMDKMEVLLDPRRHIPDFTVIDLSGVFMIDASGLDALESLHRLLLKRGGCLILVGARSEVAELIHRSGFSAELGEHGLVANMDDALEWISRYPEPDAPGNA